MTDLRLHPISLGFGAPMTERGRPMLADPALTQQILDRIVARSQQFNTRITIEKGVGRVVLTDARRSNR